MSPASATRNALLDTASGAVDAVRLSGAELVMPIGVAYDAGGRLYVVDSARGRVLVLEQVAEPRRRTGP